MRFVDEFRSADKAHALAAKIAGLCEPGRQYKLMEVCGGHTHTIYKHGLEDYLPEQITLVHGPGCPVCVIPMGRVNDAMALAAQPDTIMTSFGDMMRVPGSTGSFFDAKAQGTDIRMVYSPLDSLKIARQNPDKRVVFMAIGMETTTPSTAMTVLRAAAEGLQNFSIFNNHVTIIPAIKAILDSPDLRLDGFIGPVTDEGNRSVGETVFRALLDAAGPTGAIQVSFRIFPEHVEVDVLHSNQPPAEVGSMAPAVAARPPVAAPKPGGSTRPSTFADWMSTALRREGLTQEAAARQLGVSVKTVGRWVGGETEPRLRDLRRIQELFGELPFP